MSFPPPPPGPPQPPGGGGTPPGYGGGPASPTPPGYGQTPPGGGYGGAPQSPQQPGPYGGGPQGPGGYGGGPGGFGPPKQTNPLAIAAVVCGALSIPAALTVVLGFLLGIAGIVLGVIGRGRPGQRGLALAGILTGAAGILLSILLAVLFIALAGLAASVLPDAFQELLDFDFDGDGIRDLDDPDIDGDGVPNDQDSNEYDREQS